MHVRLVSHSQPTLEYRDLGITDAQELVAYCARVSNPANQFNTETSEKLIRYLVRHQHWSPLEMVSACCEITTTRDIARQILPSSASGSDVRTKCQCSARTPVSRGIADFNRVVSRRKRKSENAASPRKSRMSDMDQAAGNRRKTKRASGRPPKEAGLYRSRLDRP